MNKKFTKLIAAFALLVFMMPSLAGWGQTRTEITWLVSEQGYTNQQTVTDITFNDDISGLFGSGANTQNAPAYYTTGAGVRMYKFNTLAITASTDSDATISKIEFTYSQNSKDLTVSTGTYTQSTATWVGSAESVTFTVEDGSGHNRIQAIKVTYTTSGSGSSDPTITFSDQSANLGIKGVGEEFTTSFTVSQEYLDDDITLTLEGQGSLSTTSIEQGADPTEVTWTYTPNEAININTTITATSEGAEPVTFTITGEAKSYHNVIIASIANGTVTANPTQAYEGQYVTITVTPDQGYELEELTVVYGDNNEIEVDELNRFQMPDNDVTVNATFVVPAVTHWVLTNLAALTTSDVFVIVGNNGDNYAMSNNNGASSAPSAVEVTVTGNEITSDVDANIQWTISGNVTNGYTFYPNGSTTTWLYCNNSNTGVRVGTNDNKTFKIADGYLKHDGTSRYVGIYNSLDWRCYTSINSNIQDQTFAFYKKETGGVVPPSINADNVEILYSATSGNIAYTINNEPIPAGTLTAATTSEWLTIGEVGETVPFTCTANTSATERTATVTLTYTYNRETITEDVTVTQAGNPNIVDNISDITAAGSFTVRGTIVAKSQRGFIVGDGTGYVYYYNQNYTQTDYNIGDMVKLEGSVVAYGGVFEFNNSATITAAPESNYVVEDPTVLTGAQIQTRVGSSAATLSSYVQYEGKLSVSGSYYNITDIEGASTAQGSISFPLNTDFSSLNGKQVKVTGYYVGVSSSKYYNTMIGSVEEVVNTMPSVTVNPTIINAPCAGAEGTLALTYENIEEFISFDYYFCDVEGNELEEDPYWIYAEIQEENDNYSLYYTIDANDGEARSAYLKVYTFDDDLEEVYAIVTVNQAKVDYATLPFYFDGGKADIEDIDGLTQNGLGSDYNSSPTLKFDGTGDWVILKINERPGTLTFDIKGNGFSGGTFTVQTSEDGVTYTDLETYTDFGTSGNDLKEEETFDHLGEDVRYIKWIYTEKSTGNVGLGNIALDEYVTPEPFITVTPATLNVDTAEHDGTLDLTYTSLAIYDMDDFDVQYYDAYGEETEEPDWIEVQVAEQDPEIGEGYVVSYFMLESDGETRTAYFKVYAMGDNGYLVYSNLVTVTQAAPVIPYLFEYYVQDLVEGDYIIYYDGYAMKNEVSGNRLSYLTVTPSALEVIANTDPSIVWHIAPHGDYWTIYSADANAYAASNGTRNQAQMLADGTDDKALWTASGDFYREFVNKYNSDHEVNANLRENDTYGFACYSTTTGGALKLYKKKETATETYTLDIPPHQWCFIASPTRIAPANVNDLTDLYYYSEAEHYWKNKKNHDNFHGFDFDHGKGYLCAYHIEGEDNPFTLVFIGTETLDGNTKEINLECLDDSSLAGWNLVGNPFACKATLNMPCYTISGMAINTNANPANETQINPCEGVMVHATGEGQKVIFTMVADGAPAPQPNQLQLIVAQNVMSRGNVTSIVNDNAIVSFREGCQLEKFVFNADAAKLYIPQDNKEYAIVSTDAQGEMFVNFKASENGSYTLTVNPEGVEMNYLHLIDNMTGTDIDLLATPSYTFEARTTDYESRFKLVFAMGSSSDEDSFAFFSNGQLIVSNDGKATLQVIDVNGRILSSETINGSCSKTLNVPAGVYMLRLVNGDVKVQKVVVR